MTDVSDMEDRVAEVTVRIILPDINPEVAVMVAGPCAMAVARPLPLTVTEEVLDELQMTWVVISKLVPSEYAPEAANCWVIPAGMLGLAGVTDMEDRVAEFTVRVIPPDLDPKVARIAVAPAATAVARPLLFTVATTGFDELQVT